MRRLSFGRLLLLGGLVLVPAAVRAADCCRLPVTWQAAAESRIAGGQADRRPHQRLQRSLEAVARRFREHGICLEWHERAPAAIAASVFVGGTGVPQLSSLEWSYGTPEAPALLFVDRVLAVDEAGVVQIRRAATAHPGAYLAVVGTFTRRNEGRVIGNELLHILGLRDQELGVTAESDVHHVSAAQWAFARRVCEEGRGVVIKEALVRAKDECLATKKPPRARCYND